jgi:hypothetical protein
MGRAFKVTPNDVINYGYACVDSGATHDMSNGEATEFANYKPLPKGSHVLVADNHAIECLGVGTKFWRIGGQKGYIVGRHQVLHVPALKAPLLSVRQHRRHQGCSFIADNEGCYLTFPTFSIKVDDSVDCLIAYETLNPTTVDLSECDYLQEAPQRRESLAVVETQRFENARNSQQQNSTSANAWKVETRASLRRLNEQSARELEAKDKAEQIKIELARLEEESKATERQYQMPRPEAPMTTEEKLQLIQSLVDSMQK